MTLSARAKLGIALAAVVGTLVYAVIVDYGLNAGRIHYGVDVRGIDVGGLTKEQAFSLLNERGQDLEQRPVLVTAEGINCHFVPRELGWRATPFETAIVAYRVGRGRSWLSALGTRAKAWTGGVTVDWTAKLEPRAVRAYLDRCERDATALGYELRRYKLRQEVRDAIPRWPRRPVNIPIRS